MSNYVNVTVVMPCYNSEDTINRAIKSIFNQTCIPNQVVLVNDCSSDNTKNILNNLVIPEGVEVVIINLCINGGPANARNNGIDRSRNNLIAFLDADDSWHPMKIEIQLRIMMENTNCVLSGHTVKFMEYEHQNFKNIEYSLREIFFSKLIFKNYFNTPSVMIRKSDFRFPNDFRYAEDYFLWLSIANNGGNIFYIDAPLGFVHKPFYGHSGLSSSLSLMHNYEIKALSSFYKNNHVHPFYILAALGFSEFKYLVRIFKIKYLNKIVKYGSRLLGFGVPFF